MKRQHSRVAWNTAVGTGAQVLILLLAFVTTPILLNSLGATSFGTFALLGSLTGYIGILDLGIGSSLIRYMSFYQEKQDTDRVAAIATFGFLFYATFAAILLPVLIVAAPAIGPFLSLQGDLERQFPGLLVFVFCLFIGSSMTGIAGARLAATHRLDLASAANACGSIVYATLVFIFVPKFPTLRFVFTCTALQIATTGALMYIAVRLLAGRLTISPLRLRWNSMRELFSFGVWSQISSVTAIVNLEADKAIISREIGVADVTPYQVANRLALLNRTLPLQIIGSMLPDITARVSRGLSSREVAALYEHSTRSLMIATLVISGFVAGAADFILRLWLGSEIAGSSSLCIALIISYSVNNATGVGTTIFRAQGKPQFETYYGSVAAVLNVLMTIILVRPLGLNGVVLGTIFGNLVGSIFFICLFHKKSGLGWWSTVGRWLSKLCLITIVSGFCAHGILTEIVSPAASRIELLADLLVAGTSYILVFLVSGRLALFWTMEDYSFVQKIGTAIVARSRFWTK
jgi:O-antigen/teichoic acid export membrane protein